MTTGPTIADVLLLLPLARTYSYRIPEGLLGQVCRGTQVLCPVRNSKAHGIVLDIRAPSPDDPLLSDLIEVSSRPAWPADLIEMMGWVSSYYVAPIGSVARTAMPGLFARRKPVVTQYVTFVRCPDSASRSPRLLKMLDVMESAGAMEIGAARRIVPGGSDVVRRALAAGWLRVSERSEPETLPVPEPCLDPGRPVLTGDQQAALDAIMAGRGSGYRAFLLHGVTGSGKTEVYMRALEEVLASGRGAIVLVPEIALTFQLRKKFEQRFGAAAAVLHSQMSDSLRAAAWDELLAGHRRLVVGARSAIFAPVRDLGMIVVDEEHDSSYKQQEGLRYNARDLAMVRAKIAGCPVVLGSATPSLESFHNTACGKSTYLSLPSRVRELPMPEVVFANMKYVRTRGTERLFSAELASALDRTLAAGESAILFLNRRGFGRFVLCRTCGRTLECPNCSISLTHHSKPDRMICHYCEHCQPVPEQCPSCGSSEIAIVGFGTERLEEEVRNLFPAARPCRLDSDTAGATQKILQAFSAGEFNVLVGTQVVAKGHDFPAVTLVGVMLAEQSLTFPDFRAAERTFQLLTQVAGRAGRGDSPGHVVIQTYSPDNYALQFSSGHDYLGFAVEEMKLRRERGYPPFSFLASIEISSPDAVQAGQMADRMAGFIARQIEATADAGIRALGPASAAIERIRGRTRLQILLKAPSRAALNRLLWAVRERFRSGSGDLRISIDVDPVSML